MSFDGGGRDGARRLFVYLAVRALALLAALGVAAASGGGEPAPAEPAAQPLPAEGQAASQQPQQPLAKKETLEISADKRILVFERSLLGSDSDGVIKTLENLAYLEQQQEDFSAARPFLEEALATKTRLLGKEHWRVIDARLAVETNGLLAKLDSKDRRQLAEANQKAYQRRIESVQEALQIRQRLLGEKHPDCAVCLNNLAWLYSESNDLDRAEPAAREALQIEKAALGAKHPEYATTLENLAKVYLDRGDFARAEPLYRESLQIRHAAFGADAPLCGQTLHNLACMYRLMGDLPKAEYSHQEAARIQKKAAGENDPLYAIYLRDLAEIYSESGNQAKAIPLFQQALAIQKRATVEADFTYAITLHNLAGAEFGIGEFAKAEALLRQSGEIIRKVGGEKHPFYAQSLANQAWVCVELHNDLPRAKSLFQQALQIQPGSPIYLRDLARLYRLEGDVAKAMPLCRDALQAARRQLDLTAAVQSERQQMKMANSAREMLDDFLSATSEAKVPAEEAYAEVLAWKGAVSARQRAIRRIRQTSHAGKSAEISRLIDELTRSSRELANLSLVIPGKGQQESQQKKLAELSDSIERCERDLAAASPDFQNHLRQQQRTPQDLRRALEADVALVDLLEYGRFVPPKAKGEKARSARWLMAFVIRPNMPIQQIDVGPIEPIDAAIEAWRKHFGLLGNAPDEQDPAVALRRLVWDKIEPEINDAKIVLLSPDGATARFPWPALPGKNPGSYLIEDRAIAIVPVPRLLPELLAQREAERGTAGNLPAKPTLLLVGDVDYDADPGRSPLNSLAMSAPHGDRGGALFNLPRLAGSRVEIAGIAESFERQFPDAKPNELRGNQATKGAVVAQLSRNRFIHFATHGFFAPKDLKSALAAASRSAGSDMANPFARQDLAGFHPGLLSGLALAGANKRAEEGKDDGILTALEVSGLDLSQADLVTLSACETGLGQSAGGEGLLGLQRAFQVAGARSVVATLWQVRDDASRTLMVDFYENLWTKKMSKLEALRQAQLTMLHEGATLHAGAKRGIEFLADQPPDKGRRLPPYYWAAFVLSGDWE